MKNGTLKSIKVFNFISLSPIKTQLGKTTNKSMEDWFLRNGSEEEARTEKRVRTKRRTDSSIWDFGIRVRERERET